MDALDKRDVHALSPARRMGRRFRRHGQRFVRDVAVAAGLHAPRHEWRIATYWTGHPLDTAPVPPRANFDRHMVSWCKADYVADPFIVRHDDAWYLFYEAFNNGTAKGEIGVATSRDGESWSDLGRALESRYHLSYPLVVEDAGRHYLVPEAHESGQVVLYACERFPDRWRPVRQLLVGQFGDSTLFRHGGTWWMLTYEVGPTGGLRLFTAASLEHEWRPHPNDPLRSPHEGLTRPGGRVIAAGGQLLRFAQGEAGTYGESLHAFVIDELSADRYADHVVEPAVLGPKMAPWADQAMHHLDAVRQDRGEQWLVAVDGR